MTHPHPEAAGWLVLSDHPAMPTPTDLPLGKAHFTLEFALPLNSNPILLDHHADDGLERVFSVFLDGEIGLAVRQRQGARLVRHILPGPLPELSGAARMTYAWDMAADLWTLTLLLPNGQQLSTTGRKPMAPRMADLASLARPTGQRHPAVLWFGVTRSAILPDPGPWIGAATPVLTDLGLRPAGSLRLGDRIATADNGYVPLLSTRRIIAPSRGSRAPVLLRAAFFQTRQDVLISADQSLIFDGPATEYMFDRDEVLVRAGDLVDGRAALWDDRRGVALGLSLDLGQPELMICDGVLLTSHVKPTLPYPRMLLDGYEVTSLLSVRSMRASIRQKI